MTRASLLERYGPDEIVERLSPLVTPERLARIRRMLDSRIRHVQIAVEQPCDIHNALAITRSCDAFGVDRLHIVDSEVERNRRNLGRRTTRGTLHWVHTEHYPALDPFFDQLHGDGLQLAGAVADGERVLEDIPIDRPLCLLFGNEHRGLSADALDRCDYRFRIPTRGMVESLNLSVAAAVALYVTVNRYRDRLSTEGDLSEQEKHRELARQLCRHIGVEKASMILKERARS